MMKNRRRKSLLPSPSMINLNLRKILRKVDRISALPDEILVNIVRFLPLDEAQATSVLSKRWRFIWQYMLDATMTLNFDAEKYLSLFASREDLAIPWYVDWVNKAIKQYRSQNVKLFRVCYDLDNVFSRSIDKWIHFAMSKGVEMLELDLLEYGVCRRKEYRSYKIPHKLLGLIKETVWKHVCSDVARLSPCACIGFKTLKVLNLKCVDVDGEVLQYMLCNCPVLERLSLYFAQSLVSLRVVGPSIALKYLEIRGCTRMTSVEICDSNLVSFVYYGSKIHLKIFNVPLLVEVAICQSCSEDYIPTTFAQLSRCLSQLEILKLIGIILPYKRNPVFPMFTNLKHLELRFEESDHCILLQLTSFLNASPCLHKLVLELYGLTGRSGETCHKAAKSSHDYLRVVEIYGYRGRTCDLSLVKFLTESAVNLEKIVTDSTHPTERHYCFPKHRRTPDMNQWRS